jgi:hypothetical protein
MFPRSLAPLALLVVGALAGCGGGARLVQGGGDGGGVVAIPANNNTWPFHYREKAEKMMTERCPNGYVVMEEKEVVVGQKTIRRASTDTNTTDLPGTRRQPPGSLTTSTTTNTTETVPETEYRITFRPKQPGER